jgi:hypothetical protein
VRKSFVQHDFDFFQVSFNFFLNFVHVVLARRDLPHRNWSTDNILRGGEILKVHKNENFFGFDFEFCTISMLVMHK